ncbi:MAG: hypothetical protein FWE98_05450 [Oscillospiraceae bacterium]|nr:hypothetical protein [Oscillospiraceae bacterium]
MKKILSVLLAVCLLAGLIFFAEGCNVSEPEAPSEPSQTVTTAESTTEEETTEEEITEEATTNKEEYKVFSYSEIDSKFGPGPFSVNELVAVFGEPVKLFGTIFSISSGHFALIAAFEGVSFDLVSRDEGLSFDTEENYTMEWREAPEFPVTSRDKIVRIKPYSTKITDNKIDFIRGIKIGDSKEKVIAAYGGFAGSERESEGITRLFYAYRPDEIIEYTDDEIFNIASQTGSVFYSFSNGKLIEINVYWYDGYLAFD